MDKELKKIIFGLIVISLIIFVLGLVLFKTILDGMYFWFFPFLILFFLIVNAAFFAFFYKSLRKPPAGFIHAFMASIGMKLVLYLILILTYVLTSPKTALVFIITLAVAYILYTSYDLWVMLALLKQKKENSNMSKQLSN